MPFTPKVTDRRVTTTITVVDVDTGENEVSVKHVDTRTLTLFREEGGLPERWVKPGYGRSTPDIDIVFQPSTLTISWHLSAFGDRWFIDGLAMVGYRILKDGSVGKQEITQGWYGSEMPDWIAELRAEYDPKTGSYPYKFNV